VRCTLARVSESPWPLQPVALLTILPGVISTQFCQVVDEKSGRILLERARWCNTFGRRLRGLTFRRALAPGEGAVIVEKGDSRVNAGVTMVFTFIDLGVIWVNDAGRVVDKIMARPWRPSYLPQAPARFAIEADPTILELVQVGDHLRFVETS
jgi:uncharacterized membrane protein (UPF0127 family)